MEPMPSTDADLRAEIVRLRDALAESDRRHQRQIDNIRNSASYRIGAMIISLRTRSGWRNLGSRSMALYRERASRATAPPPSATAPPRSTIRAASILDEFTHACLTPELTLEPIGRRRISPVFRRRPDLLLAETAWHGNGGQWRYAFSQYESGNDLDRLVRRAQRSGIPTVLWNKEDPTHFSTFLDVASLFDVVATTDSGSIQRYLGSLDHERVTTMMFAAQPRLHHPRSREAGSERSVCFAGAWRGDVHPQRIGQLTMLLDAALETGELTIFSRANAPGQEGDDFPPRFQSHVRGSLPYSAMLDEYHRYACFLNVNTVNDSPTMMSRRVFEILACRTPVVSAVSTSIGTVLPGIVPMPLDADEALEVLGRIVSDPEHRDRLGQVGYREVMLHHTYQHRLADLLPLCGIEGFPVPDLPSVGGVCMVDSDDDVESAIRALRPLQAELRSLTVVVRRGGDRPPVSRSTDVTIVRLAGHGSAAPLDRALAVVDTEFVALLDPTAVYGTHMVTDALLATRFADADAYGKSTTHVTGPSGSITRVGTGQEFHDTDALIHGTCLVRRAAVVDTAPSTATERESLTETALRRVRRNGGSCFAVDRFNHLASADGFDAGHPVPSSLRPEDVFV